MCCHWKGNLMDNLIGYFLLFVLMLNSPLGYPILFVLDRVFHLNLFFRKNQEREITLEELDELQKMIDDFRTR